MARERACSITMSDRRRVVPHTVLQFCHNTWWC